MEYCIAVIEDKMEKKRIARVILEDLPEWFGIPEDWYDMGIVIYAPERAKGYGKQGLQLLLDRAFRVNGISKLHNEFEATRDAALRIHKAVGFQEVGVEDGQVQLEITCAEYLKKR